MAKIQIKTETRQDLIFFPLSFDDYVPKDAKVRVIDSIVRNMDSKPLLSTYDGVGAPPYSPMMMLSLVIYAYINGVYSCRGIASCLRHDIRYLWICGGQRQSFATINRFRSNHLIKCIDFYFDRVVAILVERGVIILDEQYVDGTKIESRANNYTFVWKKTILRNLDKLQAKTSAALEEVKGELKLLGENLDVKDAAVLDNSHDVFSVTMRCERQLKSISDSRVSKRVRQKNHHKNQRLVQEL